MKRYRFIDGEERHAQHPDTWYLPPLEERQAVKVGDFIQVGLEPANVNRRGGERFWFLVTEKLDNGSFVGELNNEPAYDFHQLELGDTVDGIEIRHIINIIKVKNAKGNSTTSVGGRDASSGNAAPSVSGQ